jgi:tripartite-type tricarboxylate transporter receptor subunit TctC
MCTAEEASMNNRLCRAGLGAVLFAAALTSAVAQDWPSRNVMVIIPVPAGVASDVISRVVFEQVGKQVGQTFVIENRVGAGGTIGANMVAKAAPDGHTILVYGSIAAANALYRSLPYDTVNDFTPTVLFGQTPLVVITAVGRYKTLGELVSTAKAKPGQLNYSTVGVGSAAHFGAERLAVSAGFSAQHVPFRSGEWLTEIIAGRIDFAVPPVATAIGAIRDGKLVPLAVSSSMHTVSLPNVPTMLEAGLKADAIYPFYTGAYLPAKTPRAIAEKLHAEVTKALAVPAVREKLVAIGVDPMPMTLAEFGAFFKKDVADNLELVKAAKIPTQ